MARGSISHIALTVSDLLAGRSVELPVTGWPCLRPPVASAANTVFSERHRRKMHSQ